jgi:hypothetical protein
MAKVKMIKYFIIILIIQLLVFSGCDNVVNSEIITLGSNREIFVDNFLIDKLENVSVVMHHPHDEGVVMDFDKPWEGGFCAYCTIIKNKDLFQAYYRGLPSAGKDGSNSEVTCYAESKDGINWEKPALDIYEINGSFANNVILADEAPATHNFSPFIDSNPEARPDEKYKAFGGTEKSGLIAFASPDGIHWKRMQEKGVYHKGLFDSQNVAFWSESEKCYVCYFRTWSGEGYKGFRSVSRATSDDFINWSEPVAMTFGNTTPEHLYTQQTSPYFRAPHIYVAIGGRFMPGRQVLTDDQAAKLNVDPGYFKDCSDAFLMTTRGGDVYTRTFMEAFIRPGIGLDNWVSRSNYPALNVVQTGSEEMSVYVNQDYAQPSAHLHRYSLRLDGFTSISAPYSGGQVFTKPFTFSGKELEINYSTSAAGEIRIEIQDLNGVPLKGYTMEESDRIIGNEIERLVSWSAKDNVKELESQVVRLSIYMKDADLYAVRFK